MDPVIVPRPEHTLSRKKIDSAALKVLYRLHHAGFKAYLVGGGVRDLLLGRKPKDFDIATDARPSQVKGLFRNSRTIGRRFRIVHVYFHDGMIVEVSTFRRRSEFTEVGEEGGHTGAGEGPAEADLLVKRDNAFGTPEEDACRRDITINGLFYDVSNFAIIDYVGGLADLEAGIVRTIGDPDMSFREDPVRMIRAIRHAARTGFRIEPVTYQAIVRHAPRITLCSTARLLEEIYRDLKGGWAEGAFRLLHETGLLGALVPGLAAYLGDAGLEGAALTWKLLEALDEMTRGGTEPPNSILLTVAAGNYLLDLADGKAVEPAGSAVTVPNEETAQARDDDAPGQADAAAGSDPSWVLHQTWRSTARRLGIAKKDSDDMIQILIAQPRLRRALESGFLPTKLRRKPRIAEAMVVFRMVAATRAVSVPQWLVELKERAPGEPPPEGRSGRRRSWHRGGGRFRGRGRKRPEDGGQPGTGGPAAP